MTVGSFRILTGLIPDVGERRQEPRLAVCRATGRPMGLVTSGHAGVQGGGAPRGVAAELIRWISSRTGTVISLDVPSGVDSTTGTAAGDFVRATNTMTLAVPKTGLDTDAVGVLWLADIGIPREVYRRAETHVSK